VGTLYLEISTLWHSDGLLTVQHAPNPEHRGGSDQAGIGHSHISTPADGLVVRPRELDNKGERHHDGTPKLCGMSDCVHTMPIDKDIGQSYSKSGIIKRKVVNV